MPPSPNSVIEGFEKRIALYSNQVALVLKS